MILQQMTSKQLVNVSKHLFYFYNCWYKLVKMYISKNFNEDFRFFKYPIQTNWDKQETLIIN